MNLRIIFIALTAVVAVVGFLWCFACDVYFYAMYDVTSFVHHNPLREEVDNLPVIEVCYSFEENVSSAEGSTPLRRAWDSFPPAKDALDLERTHINGFSSGSHEVNKLLKDRYICYDISLARHLIVRRNLTATPTMARIVMKPGLNKNKDPAMLVSLHSRGSSGRSGGFVQSPRASSPGSWLAVTYKRDLFQLLPSPYLTNCFNYEENGHSSQDDCYNRCLIHSKDNVTGIPFETIIEDETLLSLPRKARNGTALGNEGTHCRKQCGHRDCVLDVVTPRLISSTPSEVDQIEILFPTEPEMVTTFVPFYVFMGLVRDVVKSALIWLLVSPLPYLLFEKTVENIAAGTMGWSDGKRKRNGVTPQESVRGAGGGPISTTTTSFPHPSHGTRGSGNGVNIINSINSLGGNNNVSGGHQ